VPGTKKCLRGEGKRDGYLYEQNPSGYVTNRIKKEKFNSCSPRKVVPVIRHDFIRFVCPLNVRQAPKGQAGAGAEPGNLVENLWKRDEIVRDSARTSWGNPLKDQYFLIETSAESGVRICLPHERGGMGGLFCRHQAFQGRFRCQNGYVSERV
jgi:hypothetical protein